MKNQLSQLTIVFIFLNIAGSLMAQKDSLGYQYFSKAEDYKTKSNRDSAILFYKKALVEFEVSENIEQQVNALNQVGIVLTRQDKYEEAKTFLHKALNLAETQLDSNNLYTAVTFLALGVVYNAEEDYNTSLKYHFKSLTIRSRVLGENNSDVATNYGNIGNVYLNNKEFDKSIEAHLKAMRIREFLYGNKGNEVIQSYTGLGNAYKAKQDYKNAYVYYEKALFNKIEQKGEGHKDLVKYYKYLSEVSYLMADTEKGDLYKFKADSIENKMN